MKKKALALAVAGALGAPALALAQTSTVQIYGQARVDYNLVDQGAGLRRVDAFSSYDSYIGLRGEEKLGGGLSAWFQCESTFQPTGEESEGNGWCTRNTGVGFKGGFGNVFWGNWDTPYKIVSGSVYRPFSTSGSFGNAALLHNGSASNVGNGVLAGTTPLGAGTGANENAGFSRRQLNLISWHSPNWAGFNVMAAYSATDESTQITTVAPTSKPRLYSLAGSYTAGPLYLALGYEQHRAYNPGAGQVFGTTAGTYNGSGKDRGVQAIAAYTFGPIRIGAAYSNLKYEVAGIVADGAGAMRDSKVRSWALYGDWRIAGPHTLRMGYVNASDVKGNGTVAVNNLAAPNIVVAGVVTRLPDTGAQLFLIQYAYAFSKRTEINFGFAKLDNERNSRHVLQSLARRNTCENAGTAVLPATPPGTLGTACDRDQDAWVVGIIHRF